MKHFREFVTEAATLHEDRDERNVSVNGVIVGKLMFMSAYMSLPFVVGNPARDLPSRLAKYLSHDEQAKLNRTNVVLVPSIEYTAYLGAPVKWTAPNGVLVVYVRGQRRDDNYPSAAEGSTAIYHDFNPGSECIVAATRNDGPARRALRAWASTFLKPKASVRFQARQLVRPGD